MRQQKQSRVCLSTWIYHQEEVMQGMLWKREGIEPLFRRCLHLLVANK